MKDDMVETLNFTDKEKYIHFFQPYRLSRSLAPPLGRGGIDICPQELLCLKFDAKKLLFKAIFGIMRILGSVQPKSKCIFPFLHNSIFQPYRLSSSLTPLWGVADICPCGLFYPKFDTEKLLFEAFFGILCIFGSVHPKSEYIFPFLYDVIFHLNTGDNHMLSLVAIKNGVCPHSGCSSALAGLVRYARTPVLLWTRGERRGKEDTHTWRGTRGCDIDTGRCSDGKIMRHVNYVNCVANKRVTPSEIGGKNTKGSERTNAPMEQK